MFKPTARLLGRLRRLPLTTKQTNKGFYKGSGTGMLGTIDTKGRFKVDLEKVRTFVVPFDLEDTRLTPFVTRKQVQNKPLSDGTWEAPMKHLDGPEYLKQWIEEGNQEEYLTIHENAQDGGQAKKKKDVW